MQLPPAKKVRAAILFVALLALEGAPVQAWLVVYAAAESGDIRLTAAPFWLILGTLVLFALARWRIARLKPLAMWTALIVCWAISLLALINISPLAYVAPGVNPSFAKGLGIFARVLLPAMANPGIAINFGLLAIYLGWRGAVLGGGAPLHSRVSRRFSVGMGALTLAIFGSLASAPRSASSVSAILLALTLLEGLAGLTALELSHPAAGSRRTDAIVPGAEYSFRWQVTALLIALGIVGSVAIIGGALDLGALRSMLAWLAPVTILLNRFGSWLTQSLAYVLYLLFVSWLSWLIPKNLKNSPIHKPTPPVDKNHVHHPSPIPPEFLTGASLIVGVLATLVILILLYIAARAIAKALSKSVAEDLEEERERLDAISLLRQQARNMLHRWRGVRRQAVERDELRRGSVRWLYRELLRVGARVGYERQASETPNEYATRLAGALNTDGSLAGEPVADDLRAITQAYDNARYGAENDDPPATDAVAKQSSQTTKRIIELGNEPAQRRR